MHTTSSIHSHDELPNLRTTPEWLRDNDPAPSPSHWYAVYTRANHESRVSCGLRERGIEHLFPQYKSLRKWKDRQIILSMPFFPGYVFVQLELQNRLKVLQVAGVASIVSFAGKPAVVPEEEFERIRMLPEGDLGALPHPYLKTGRRARVLDGPFAGLEGIIVRRNKRKRLVVSLEMLERSIAVELGEASLEMVK